MKLNFKNTLKPALATTAGFAAATLVQPQLDKLQALPSWGKEYGTLILGALVAGGLGKALKLPNATEIGVGMILHGASRQLPKLLGRFTSAAPAPAPAGSPGGYSDSGLGAGLAGPTNVMRMPGRTNEEEAMALVAALAA